MRLKPYNKYKASEIEWIDQIPVEWEVKRVKDLADLQSGKNLTSYDLDDKSMYPVYGGNGFRGYYSEYTHNGTFALIGRQGALCGNINYGKNKFWATDHAVVAKHKKSINVLWFGELLKIMDLNQYSLSAAQPGLSVETIKKLKLPYTNYQTQTTIANYLDQKTAELDKKIELLTVKSAKYDELKKVLINETVCRGLDKNVALKESGIEWIGNMPKHWEVKRVKDVSILSTGNSIAKKELYINPNNSYPYISSKDINVIDQSVDYDNGIYIPKSNTAFKISIENTILLCIEGGSAGKKIAFIDKKVCYVNKLCSFNNSPHDTNNKYIFYLLRSSIFKSQFFAVINGLIGGVSISAMKRFKLVFPPCSEQTQIANYLDEKCDKIDEIRATIEKEIKLLQELRKTLINDVVTGKVSINE